MAFHLGFAPVFVVEATALHRGVSFTLQLNINSILIEGDNLLVVNAIKGSWKAPWHIQAIIRDIQILP